MSGFVRGVLAGIAVLAGVSPLLWITASEYRAVAQADEVRLDREALLQRARDLVGSGAQEELGALVRETRESHLDDVALARELAMILLQGAHSPPFSQRGAREPSRRDSP